MLLLVNIPAPWFNDELSFSLCDELGQPRIKAHEWIDLLTLYSFKNLPQNFELPAYLESDKLHGILFTYGEEQRNVLLHRKGVFKLVNRGIKQAIKREVH